MKTRVAIVEDQRMTLDGLAAMVDCSETLEVVGGFTTGEDALRGMPRLKPDVALVDLGLPGISGIDVIREIKTMVPSMEILVLTVHEDKTHLFSALKAGAAGYLLKDATPGEIIGALEEIKGGGSPMSPRIARYVIEFFHETRSENNNPNDSSLTAREKEILRGIADALTYKQLADKFFLSPHTVRSHIKNIYDKLHAHSKVEVLTRARERGVL